MKLDWTISVGNILTAAVLLGGFITAHVHNIRRIQAIETQVTIIFGWFERNIINGKGGK